MPIQIGQHVAHGFDQPLGLLRDCHRRIEHFLEVLVAVHERSTDGTLTPELRRALEGALNYFSTAAPKHTADEEESLFPRLKAAGTDGRIATLLDRLEREHGEADEHHHAVDTIGRKWLAEGRLDQATLTELRRHLDGLRGIYEHHIVLEDGELFPAAATALSTDDLAAVGQEMAARRALSPIRRV